MKLGLTLRGDSREHANFKKSPHQAVRNLTGNRHIQNSHTITSEMLPNQIINNGKCNNLFEMNVDIMSMPLRQARELFERKYLTAQMVRFNNNISKTSTFVGMERSALHRKLKLLNVHNNIDLSTVDME